MEEKIALLIDCENISAKYLENILGYLDHIGDVFLKRAYGDWQKDYLNPWRSCINRYGIEYICTSIDGKNSSDMKICIDAMNILLQRTATCIAIASSDSDFSFLASEIRQKGLKAVGFGEDKSKERLKNSFNEFITLNSLQNTQARCFKNTDELNSKQKEIIKQIILSIKENITCGGKALVSQVAQHLKNRNIDISGFEGCHKAVKIGEILKAQKSFFTISYEDNKKKMLVEVKENTLS